VTPDGSVSATTTFVAASGPRFFTLTVYVMVEPTVGPALLTLLVTARSAAATVTLTLAESSAAAGSPGNDDVTAAAAVRAWPAVPGSTVAATSSVALSPGAIVPASQAPVPGANVPWLGVSPVQVSPAGTGADTETADAVSGPAFETRNVSEIASPSSGSGLLAPADSARSALRTVSCADAAFVVVSGSVGSIAVIAAAFTIPCPAVPGSTDADSCSATPMEAPSAPIVHVPPVESYAVPPPAAWPAYASPAGSTSVTRTPEASSGPKFATARL
jgi:hypothetical protein